MKPTITYGEVLRRHDRERSLRMMLPVAVLPWAGFGSSQLFQGASTPPLLAFLLLTLLTLLPTAFWVVALVQHRQARRAYTAAYKAAP